MSLSVATGRLPIQPVAAGSILELAAEVDFLVNRLAQLGRAEQLATLEVIGTVVRGRAKLESVAALADFARSHLSAQADRQLDPSFAELLPRHRNELVGAAWEEERLGDPAGARERLATIVAGRASPDAIGIGRERQLLTEIDRGPMGIRFATLGTLSGLYLRYLRQGGSVGVPWVEQMRRALTLEVEARNLYHELVRINDDGPAILTLPDEARRPSTLRFPPSAPRPSVLFLPSGTPHTLGSAAYFLISDLVTGQDIVSDLGVAAYREMLDAGRPFKRPVTISIDRPKGVFHIWDGNNRAHAASLRGDDYLLGRLSYNYPVKGSPRRVADLRVVPDEEYQARARKIRLDRMADEAEEPGLAGTDEWLTFAVRWALRQGPPALRRLLERAGPPKDVPNVPFGTPPEDRLLLALFEIWSAAFADRDESMRKAAVAAWDALIGPLRPPSEDLRALVATGYQSATDTGFYRGDATLEEIEATYRERFGPAFWKVVDLSPSGPPQHRLFLIQPTGDPPRRLIVVSVREFTYDGVLLIHTKEWLREADGRVFPLHEDVQPALIPVETD